MIMSSGKNQTWTGNNRNNLQNNTNSLRRFGPPPAQPAPQKPTVSLANDYRQPVEANFRSHTLNRLDILRAKHQQQQKLEQDRWSSLRRNKNDNNYHQRNRETPQKLNEIYAPASIASPNEFVFKQNNFFSNRLSDSQHYAATSCKDGFEREDVRRKKENGFHVSGRESTTESRSGRESALGNLWARFGTLRRKSKLLSLGKKSSSSLSASSNSRTTTPIPSLNSKGGPPPIVTSLDPEIYAKGKRQVNAEEIYAEGLVAIDGNCQKRLIEYEIEENLMVERERRILVEEHSKDQPDYKLLVRTLINWINDELAEQRIIVKDLQDDLYDGQILSKLVEKLQTLKLDLVEVTQNEFIQKSKLETVLNLINRLLFNSKNNNQSKRFQIKWTVEGIHSKNMVEIIYLLVALAKHFGAPIKIPENVCVLIIIVEKYQNQLIKRSQQVQLTEAKTNETNISHSPTGIRQRDVFDTLVDYAPDKLTIVKQSLVKFANRHLNKINMSCLTDRVHDILEPEQFSDGLLLVFLISSLEGFFVPLGQLFTNAPAPIYSDIEQEDNEIIKLTTANMLQTALEPDSYINTQPLHKLHNVNFALQLMEDASISIKHKVRPEDIVNGDLKSVLRVLYALFSRYKHL